jgi:hypothetical protein
MTEEPDQGVLAEGCPYCILLHPGTDPCPRCRGDTVLRPARMMDADSVRRAVLEAADGYDGTRSRLDALLDLLFLYAPVSVRALEEHGRVTLERLRRADANLPENLVGRTEEELLARFGPPERRRGDQWEYPGPGPTDHVRVVIVLRLRDGRVTEQSERRLPAGCDPLGPLD